MKIFSRAKDVIVVEDISRLSVQPDEVLLVTYDFQNLPSAKRKEMADDIVNLFKTALPNVRVVVVPKQLSVSVVQP